MKLKSIALVSVLAFQACASTPKTTLGEALVFNPKVKGQDDEDAYKKASEYRDQQRYAEAENALSQILKDFPKTRYRKAVMFDLVFVNHAQGLNQSARAWLAKVREEDWAGDEHDRIAYFEGLLRESKGQAEDPFLKEADETKGTTEANMTNSLAPVVYTELMSVNEQLRVDPSNASLLAHLDQLLNVERTSTLIRDNTFDGSIVQEHAYLKRIRSYLASGEVESLKAIGSEYMSKHPQGVLKELVAKYTEHAGSLARVDKGRVGILLPMSGDYSRFGKSTFSALLLALGVEIEPEWLEDGVFPDSIRTSNGLEILLRDTKGDSAHAEELAFDLIANGHVMALVGDIMVDTAPMIATQAENYGVPLLALSREASLTEIGQWTFRLATPYASQNKALVEYLVNNLGHKRFAVLYPEHPYGLEMSEDFRRQAESLGAKVVLLKSYEHNQTTFTKEARIFAGKPELSALPEYQDCAESAETLLSKSDVQEALEACEASVDLRDVRYDALYIPDNFKSVSFIIPALVAEDLLVSQSRGIIGAFRQTTSSRMKPIQLVGPHLWYHKDLLRRLKGQVEGALIAHNPLILSSGDEASERYEELFDREPDTLASVAYDAGKVLLKAFAVSGIESREDLRQRLVTIGEVQGWHRPFSFLENGENTLGAELSQVQRRDFVLIEDDSKHELN